MEHTRGPLCIIPRDVDLNGYPVHSSIEVESPEGPRVVALVLDCAEAEANARLIAAAPDLLKAVQAIGLQLDGWVAPSNPIYLTPDEARNLLSAITKAIGP